MKIKSLSLEILEIPFKQSFSHAAASRNKTEAIIVTAESNDGLFGYGEGCPREYVTQESLVTAEKFFTDFKSEIISLTSLDDIRQWMLKNQQVVDQNPAAWCAIELALLDLLGKETHQDVEELLLLPHLTGIFHYSAVLGANSLSAFTKQLQKYHTLGFTDFKVKISGNLDEDKLKIAELKKIPGGFRLRLDANNLWYKPEQVIAYIKQLNVPIFAIEEPLNANDFEAMSEVFNALKIPIILDESFLRIQQFERINNNPNQWIINCRISKMGGLLRSIAVAEEARQLNIPLIVGAQVGESSILTRAALTIANACRDNVIAQEGAFGTYLLEQDVIEKSIMFGKNGQLDTHSLANRYGLGVK